MLGAHKRLRLKIWYKMRGFFVYIYDLIKFVSEIGHLQI